MNEITREEFEELKKKVADLKEASHRDVELIAEEVECILTKKLQENEHLFESGR